MATTLYLRNIACNDPKPTGKLSTDTDSFTSSPTNKNVALQMLCDKGEAQTSAAGLYNTGTTPLYSLMRIFVSPPLMEGQIIAASGTYTTEIGNQESNVNMNFYCRYFIYVMSSALANSKTLVVPSSDVNETGNSEEGQVNAWTGATGAYTVARGDRIVLEVWGDIRNTRTTNYTGTFYFDGTTDIVDAAGTTDAASCLIISQDLLFASPRTPAINITYSPGVI